MKRCTLTALGIALYLLLAGSASAQSVQGTVVDAESGDPLAGVTVAIVGTMRGTTTDLYGEFTLGVSDFPVTLRVSFVGFKAKLVDVSSSGTITVELESGVALDEIVAVGTRGQPRTVLSSPVPIDNINAAELETSGQITIDQMINYRVPSYNSSNQTISDATAHFDPSELRNMGPSRTLVLVNGKRKNQSALVYVNDTPGKGEVGVDMKSIPASAIERVEVLRDGASSLYGSDAIAGVVNIVLKERYTGQLDLTSGVTTEGDGLFYGADINKGFQVGDGSLSLTGSFYHQDHTNRPGEPGGDGLFGVIFGDDDILNGSHPWIQANPDLGMTIGQPDYTKGSLVANFTMPFGDGAGEFYAFGGGTIREGTSFALYRAPYWITDDAGLLTPTGEEYNGFQPTFETGIGDFFGTAGAQIDLSGWATDASLSFGANAVDYTVGNTINPSLLPNSPTDFDAGGYTFGNLVANVDASRTFDQLTFSLGTEARRESFEVRAGQEESYVDGGAQSFPGLQPSNELTESRTNVGVYGGVDFDVTETFLVGASLRFENYSDFGSNLSWKLAARQLFGDDKGVVRGSINTGFRAPSLHQIYLSNVQTLVSGGTVSNQGTFNNVSSVIKGLGVPSLDAEKSFSLTGGITYRLTDQLSVSADYYNIALKDRVLFTGEIGFDGNEDENNPVEEILITNSVTSIKFFVNAMDTRTQGLDLVVNLDGLEIGDSGNVNLIWATNFNSTEIDGTINAPGVIGSEGYDIFNRKEQSRVTTARPNLKSSLSARGSIAGIDATLNNTYFGEVTWQHATDETLDQTFGARVITDLILGYTVMEDLRLNFTVNNLFNIYPDAIEPGSDFVTDLGGRFKWPWEVNQFGFNGTTVRVGLKFGF